MPFLDASGTPTDPTTPDAEVSKDGAAFADCFEEVATITGSNGMGHLTLTGNETDAAAVALAAKVASGPRTTLGTLYPRQLPRVGTGTLSAAGSGGGTLSPILGYDLTNCFFKTLGGTGGGSGMGLNQARRVDTYDLSTGQFTVAPVFEVTPDTTTTYEVLLPEGVTLGMLKGNVTQFGGVNGTFSGGYPSVNTTHSAGLPITNEDGVFFAASSTTVTIPPRDSAGNPIPNQGQYTFREFPIVGGTGQGTVIRTTTVTGSSGQYNVLAGTMPVVLDDSSKYVVGDTWNANFTHMSGVAVTGRDVGASVVAASVTAAVTVGTNNDKTGYALTAAQASGIADWVWDELLSQHAANGTAGSGLLAASTGGGLDAAAVRAAIGLASANLDTQLGAIAGFIDTEVAAVASEVTAVKAKTDQLAFGVANALDVNVTAVGNNTSGVAAFARAIQGIAHMVVGNGSSTTSIVTSSITPAAVGNNQFKGRIVVFDRNTTTPALRSQATDITSNVSGTLTVTALSASPVLGDFATIQ